MKVTAPVQNDEKINGFNAQISQSSLSNHQPLFQFQDNRQDLVQMQSIQQVINNSSKVKESSQFIERISSGKETLQMQSVSGGQINYQSNQTIQLQGNSSTGASNHTGLPDQLKSGIENLSGYSMNDVKVHYNSPKPAQLNAYAYAQGTDIHVASGQEKHLAHEAWHVVQQKQGRVKPTMQLKGKVSVNDDQFLEQEADMMGAKAESFDPSSENTKQLMHSGGDTGLIQRKVGLEIETPVFRLYPGNIPQQQPRRNRHVDRQALLDDDQLGHDYGAFDDEEQQAQPFVESDNDLEKGRAIISGEGWKLTADLIGGQGVIEFITDPVDETNAPNQLGNIARSIAVEANRVLNLGAVGGFSQLAPDVVVRRMPGGIEGNIQITGGIKVDQIVTLLDQVAGWNGGDLIVDGTSRALLRQSVDAAQDAHGTIAARGNTYQGLIALLGAYVAGQRRYHMMAQEGHARIRDGRNVRGDFYRIQYCANAADVENFMRTGAVAGSDHEIQQQYGARGGRPAFYEELRAALREVIAPRAAKMMVPVLSRSSLAELKDKANVPNRVTFIADVMTAAGEPGGDANTRLFPIGLDTDGHAGRTIEARPDITVQDWLGSIHNGQNLTFSDATKSFEKVGPSDVPCFCGLSTTRAKGAVLEIRALDGDQLVPVNRWGNLADTVSQAFVALNQ